MEVGFEKNPYEYLLFKFFLSDSSCPYLCIYTKWVLQGAFLFTSLIVPDNLILGHLRMDFLPI